MLEAFLERLDRKLTGESQERKNLLNCKRIQSQPLPTDRHLDDAISLLSEEFVRFKDLSRERRRKRETSG